MIKATQTVSLWFYAIKNILRCKVEEQSRPKRALRVWVLSSNIIYAFGRFFLLTEVKGTKQLLFDKGFTIAVIFIIKNVQKHLQYLEYIRKRRNCVHILHFLGTIGNSYN